MTVKGVTFSAPRQSSIPRGRTQFDNLALLDDDDDDDDDEEYVGHDDASDDEDYEPTLFHLLWLRFSGFARYLGGQKRANEFLVYCVFVMLFTIVSCAIAIDGNTRPQNNAIIESLVDRKFLMPSSNLLGTFEDIRSADDWWAWASEVLASSLNGPQPGYINKYLRVIGQMRIRQLRVRADACTVPQALQGLVPGCFAAYTRENEDTGTFGPVNKTGMTAAEAFYWNSSAQLREGVFVGRWSATRYEGSGYVQTLPLDAQQARLVLAELRSNTWIDLQTRLVFVDFVAHNSNVGLLSLVKLSVEFPASSFALPAVTLRTHHLRMLLTAEADPIYLLPEGLILVMCVCYIILEMRRAWQKGKWYWAVAWNWLELINIIAFFCAFNLRMAPFSLIGPGGFPPNPEEFINYETAMWSVTQWQNIMAFCSVLTWLRLGRTLQRIPFIRFMIKCISHSAVQLVPVLFIMGLLVFGFAIAHCLLFGSKMAEFSTIALSFFTLYRSILYLDVYDKMYEIDWLLGPFWFVSWSFVGHFVLTSIFFAVLAESVFLVTSLGDGRTGVLDTAKAAFGKVKDAQGKRAKRNMLMADIRRARRRLNELPVWSRRTPEQTVLAEALELQRSTAIEWLRSERDKKSVGKAEKVVDDEKIMSALDIRIAKIASSCQSLLSLVKMREQQLEKDVIKFKLKSDAKSTQEGDDQQ